jgi:hypothetical protein
MISVTPMIWDPGPKDCGAGVLVLFGEHRVGEKYVESKEFSMRGNLT